MSDLDSYITRCYDLLLTQEEGTGNEEEMCACSKLVDHENKETR